MSERMGFKTVENVNYVLQIVCICTVYMLADSKYDEICLGQDIKVLKGLLTNYFKINMISGIYRYGLFLNFFNETSHTSKLYSVKVGFIKLFNIFILKNWKNESNTIRFWFFVCIYFLSGSTFS